MTVHLSRCRISLSSLSDIIGFAPDAAEPAKIVHHQIKCFDRRHLARSRVSSRTYAYELHATEPGLKAGAGDSFLSANRSAPACVNFTWTPDSCFQSHPLVESRDIFIRASSSLEERSVDLLYMKPAILHGLDRVGDLDQLAGGFLWVGIAALSGEFHQAVSRCAQRTWSGTSPTVRLAPQKQLTGRPSIVLAAGTRYPPCDISMR